MNFFKFKAELLEALKDDDVRREIIALVLSGHDNAHDDVVFDNNNDRLWAMWQCRQKMAAAWPTPAVISSDIEPGTVTAEAP